ncbi:unnamed protein product, partial [Callosobruchus maculatus]
IIPKNVILTLRDDASVNLAGYAPHLRQNPVLRILLGIHGAEAVGSSAVLTRFS